MEERQFSLDDFPLHTAEPTIAVTLPAGRYRAELVVADQAGLPSRPATVPLVVMGQTAPTITAIQPARGGQGQTINAVIQGINLGGTTLVSFVGIGVSARVLSNATAERVPIQIAIADNAALGERTFTLRTAQGTVNSKDFLVTFTVTTVLLAQPSLSQPILTNPIEPTPLQPRSTVFSPSVSVQPTQLVSSRAEDSRPVDEVLGIGPVYRSRLESNGIMDITQLAAAEPSRVANILQVSEPRAQSFITQAQSLLRDTSP